MARVYASGPGVYGCSQRTGHTSRLGQSTTCLSSPKVTVAAVAGQLAAYGLQKCGVDTGAGSLVVRRLSDGRQLGVFEAISGPVGPESYRSVGSVVVKADGAVAWIGVASSIISHRRTIEVHEADAGGRRVLDSSAGIRIDSLRLRGSALTWTDGGRTRSASLQ